MTDTKTFTVDKLRAFEKRFAKERARIGWPRCVNSQVSVITKKKRDKWSPELWEKVLAHLETVSPAPKSTDEDNERAAEFFAEGNVDGLEKEIVDAGYRALAKKCHPDAGGTDEQMRDLNKAVGKLRSRRAA